MTIVKNNSGLLMLMQNSSILLRISENSRWQMQGKHGHMVISAICSKHNNSKSLLIDSMPFEHEITLLIILGFHMMSPKF